MKRNTSLLVLGAHLLLGLGLSGGYWLAMHRLDEPMTLASAQEALTAASSTGTPSPASADKVDPKSGRKVLYWHDPMVPGQKFDRPGKSPFMDMDLVPVYADEASDAGGVTISPRTIQNLGIRTTEVKEGALDTGFSAVGAVGIDERGITTVQSRASGYVEKLYVTAQYDPVKRGQRLIDLYAPDWLSAENEYLVLKRSRQPGAAALAEAARERLTLLGISEDQIRKLEREGNADPRVTLYAPDAGVVWELGVREGMAVSPGMTLFKLAPIGTVWVNAEVPETQAALVRPGAPVQGRTAAFPDKVFKGKVAALLPDVNPTTRTIKARIVLANPGGLLKPGMFARLEFDGREQRALLVPAEAVIYTGKRNVVILADGDGKFRPVEVEVGRDGGDATEIRKGLDAGQKVVASGQFLIDSEASLKTTLERLNAPGQAARSQVQGKEPKP
ncbi:MAG TPA: efflux RND transporter periplasmic adaptor subunit [Burkholderiales bacterium]|nr:efflux RND transporter periplasmic adaptor subunit [Burkholderiales bacterium]